MKVMQKLSAVTATNMPLDCGERIGLEATSRLIS
jgi:hypothetical protein